METDRAPRACINIYAQISSIQMPSTNPPEPATRDADTAEADVAIIGTGFAGLGAAIRLMQEGA